MLVRHETATPRGYRRRVSFTVAYGAAAERLAAADCRHDRIPAVGVGCGGPMVYPEGLRLAAQHPGLARLPAAARLEADFGLPTLVDNDAKAFALGEYWVGGGRGARCLLAMVVSTGVGGGMV